MGVRSIFSRLNHPAVWTTISVFAVAGAVYYFKRQKNNREAGVTDENQDPEVIDPEAVGDLDVTDAQVVQDENPNKSEMTIEDFSCITVLGRGTFGKVVLGEYKKTQELFAIKAIKKRDVVTHGCVNQLKCEQRILELVTRAHHPFLSNMFASFQTEVHTCFVLEYAAAGDLLSLSLEGRISEARTLFYSACAVLGIEFLHSNNIAHRDIKLANMLVDAEGYLKIADFGYCKEEMGFSDYTNSMAGTLDYLAPEVLIGKMYTHAVDWWGLGVCMYQMLVGQTPFYDNSEMKTRCNILCAPVTCPNFLSKETVLIIKKLTLKLPERRLGGGPSGAEEVKGHSYFRDITWDELLARRMAPPWVPPIKDRRNVHSSQDPFSSVPPSLTPPLDSMSLTQDEKRMFESFKTSFPP